MVLLAPKLPYTHAFAGGYPRRGGQPLPSDADAIDYLERVAAADGAAVEVGVAVAVDAFVRGCKTDGIWDAIKASCLLCGPRTLSGALVGLKSGTDATNVGDSFVEGDYNRVTGLKGDGSTTYLDSGRANNADEQDDQHIGVFVTEADAAYERTLVSGGGSLGGSEIYTNTADSLRVLSRYGGGGTTIVSTAICAGTGLFALSRSDSIQIAAYAGISFGLRPQISQAPTSSNIAIFSRSATSAVEPSASRLAFYSIGASLSLESLDRRISDYVAAIAAAL